LAVGLAGARGAGARGARVEGGWGVAMAAGATEGAREGGCAVECGR
jgi:hypothetical protein